MRISIIIRHSFSPQPLASLVPMYIGEQVTSRLPIFFCFAARWPTIEKTRKKERKKSIVSFNDDIILSRALLGCS